MFRECITNIPTIINGIIDGGSIAIGDVVMMSAGVDTGDVNEFVYIDIFLQNSGSKRPRPIALHPPSRVLHGRNVSPDATTPHENAHIGGNQVIGLSNSANAKKEILT